MDREMGSTEPSLDDHEVDHSVADAIRSAMGDPASIEEEEMLEAAEIMDIDHHHL